MPFRNYDPKAGRLRTQNPLYVRSMELTLMAKGYDPRIAKPIPPTTLYNGGSLPYSQMLSYSHQYLYASHDMIDFDSVPQYCSSNRVVILRNVSTSDVDFTIDLSQFNIAKGASALNK
jgi:hypothetical protein